MRHAALPATAGPRALAELPRRHAVEESGPCTPAMRAGPHTVRAASGAPRIVRPRGDARVTPHATPASVCSGSVFRHRGAFFRRRVAALHDGSGARTAYDCI